MADSLLDGILDVARLHGESGESEDGATHEVGDLQEALGFAWELLSEADRAKVHAEFMANRDADFPLEDRESVEGEDDEDAE